MTYKHPFHGSPLMVLLILYSQLVKSLSMWRAARNRNPGWFLLLAFTNTLGLLDFLYIMRFPIKRSNHSKMLHKLFP